MTIQRLEKATHITANLATNIKATLKDLNIRSVAGWTDSTIVLHWLRKQRINKVFVENRAKMILRHEFMERKYVPTKQNPGDTGKVLPGNIYYGLVNQP